MQLFLSFANAALLQNYCNNQLILHMYLTKKHHFDLIGPPAKPLWICFPRNLFT